MHEYATFNYQVFMLFTQCQSDRAHDHHATNTTTLLLLYYIATDFLTMREINLNCHKDNGGNL